MTVNGLEDVVMTDIVFKSVVSAPEVVERVERVATESGEEKVKDEEEEKKIVCDKNSFSSIISCASW